MKKYFPKIICTIFLYLSMLILISGGVGSLADWISGIGSIGAIIFVYFQIKQSQEQFKEQSEQTKEQFKKQLIESKEQLDKQLKNEKENAFRIERPLFKILIKRWWNISQMDTSMVGNNIKKYIPLNTSKPKELPLNYHSINSLLLPIDNSYSNYTGLYIKNISDKSILAIKCVISIANGTEINETLAFKIDKMKSDEEVILLLPISLIHAKYRNKNKKVIVYYNTVIREQIRLVFTINSENRLEYTPEEKWMENKNGSWPQLNSEFTSLDSEYDLNDFEESRYFK